MQSEKFDITGMTCAACQANITRKVSALDGVETVDVNLLANSMQVSYDEKKTNTGAIIAAVTQIGYGASPAAAAAPAVEKNGLRSRWNSRRERAVTEQKQMKNRLIFSVILLVPLMYLSMGGMLGLPLPSFLLGAENFTVSAILQLLFTLFVVFINRKFYISGFQALWHRAPNMDSLVAVGSGASLLYGIYVTLAAAYAAGHGNLDAVHSYMHALYLESAAMILTLVTVGKYLESRSKAKTSDALDQLADLAPKTANVLRGGKEISIPSEQVAVGDIVIIRPGDSIPVDGVIVEGSGSVNQSAITGESIPVDKTVGDTVISATVNQNGAFRYEARQVGEDTTLAKIIRLVDEAGSTKAPIARIADKVSGVFVPIVMAIALVTAVVWLIAGQSFSFALTNAVSVLVISCPCALGLATPVAIMVGTGKAAELGILIKSAESLENLHHVDTVVLDKTGTVTSGDPSVTDILPLDTSMRENDLLRTAAAAEQGSAHPLALAIVKEAQRRGLSLPEAKNFSSTSGKGITAEIDGKTITAGNARLMREAGLLTDTNTQALQAMERLAAEGKTPILFAMDGKLTAVIALADTIRPTSRRAIPRFHEMGIRVVLLTGDNKLAAEAVRRELEIDEVIAEVLPADKEAQIRRLQKEGRKVAMIGDGINDAPALTAADIGIAIGAGTDIAIDSADLVLMKDSLEDAVTAIELSRAVMKNIKMNLFWAFFYNALGIPLAAGVLYPFFELTLSPMIASAAMSLSSVSVVTNALRLRFFKPKHKAASEATASETNTPAAPALSDSANACINNTCPITITPASSTAEKSADENHHIKQKGNNTMTKTLKIDGMMCNHCKMHVENALNAIDGVTGAEADVEAKKATVTLSKEVADDVLSAAVTEAGYTVVGVE